MHQENKINLSIIIPVYNEESFLLKLFTQIETYFNEKNIEVIIVDDGSNDKSTEIIKNYKDRNIHEFIFKSIRLDINSGKGKAIQTGIKNSQGQYILLQDADLELETKLDNDDTLNQTTTSNSEDSAEAPVLPVEFNSDTSEDNISEDITSGDNTSEDSLD